MIILSTIRYGEKVYGSASNAILNKLEPTHNKEIRLALGIRQYAALKMHCA
jgi:hypothetical protein